jgi:cell shape-determining protein MreD
MNCIIRTITGAVTGVFKGKFFLDFIIMPAVLCALATILKAVIIFILHLFMRSAIPAYSLTTSTLWIELGLNALSGPLIFLILRKFKPILAIRS